MFYELFIVMTAIEVNLGSRENLLIQRSVSRLLMQVIALLIKDGKAFRYFAQC